MIRRMARAKLGSSPLSPLIVQWKAKQAELRARIEIRPLNPLPRFVAGADAAFSSDKKTIFAVALVYDRQAQRVVEVAHAVQEVTAPYIPGFLSFREGPAVTAALRSLKHEFGVVCFDGHGWPIHAVVGTPLTCPSS
jgi:deoxyribonuclease V